MGREIRMVPPNWQHPKTERLNHRTGRMEDCYQPLYDRAFAPAMREWIAAWEAWERGERPAHCTEEWRDTPFWEWAGGPPDPDYHRPDWSSGEMTWWQVYETVSEGTPVTPSFATQQELVDYLCEHGDFWDQKRRAEGGTIMRCTPWPRAEAEAFVFGSGWALSMALIDGKVMSGTEAILASKAQEESTTAALSANEVSRG